MPPVVAGNLRVDWRVRRFPVVTPAPPSVQKGGRLIPHGADKISCDVKLREHPQGHAKRPIKLYPSNSTFATLQSKPPSTTFFCFFVLQLIISHLSMWMNTNTQLGNTGNGDTSPLFRQEMSPLPVSS
jgi:hypothetical protein